MEKLRLSDEKSMSCTSATTKKQLEKLTIHYEQDIYSLMYAELQISPARRNTNIVTATNTAGLICAWGIISANNLLQIYVSESYRSYENGTRIAAKLVKNVRPARKNLYIMAHDQKSIFFWRKFSKNYYPMLWCGMPDRGCGWTFMNEERLQSHGHYSRLFVDTNPLITPDTQFHLREGTEVELYELRLALDENMPAADRRRAVVTFSKP